MRRSLTAMLALVLAIMLSGSVQAAAATRSYDDYDYITSHVTLAVPQQASICNPTEDLSTAASNYYLTGTSDPNATLYLNGVEVPGRGIYGSWGVYVPLYMGENVYTLKQGSVADTVTITRADSVTTPVDSMTKAYPVYDSLYRAGDTLELSCLAPEGATVSVQFGELGIVLTQTTKPKSGMPAKYSGSTVIGGVTAARKMGKLTYTMDYNGKTSTVTTEGNILLVPADQQAVVKVADSVATVYGDTTKQQVSGVVRGGAVDYITGQDETYYTLSSGHSIPKESVTPVLGVSSITNKVIGLSLVRTKYGERLQLHGSQSPLTTVVQLDDKLTVTMYNTVLGTSAVDLSRSKLFTEVRATTSGSTVVLEMDIEAGKAVWGNTVEYANGTTSVYAMYPPKSAGNPAKPLSGIIVGLDAGHGGSDPGAFGTARLTGPVEKDINMATALAVQKRLESLGAKVLTTTYREGEKSTVNDRMEASLAGKADYYIALHCNANPAGGDGSKPAGTEIYHYYSRSKFFADALQKQVVAETGRKSRGVKQSNFRVTMNSLTPAVLVELGFVTNPVEYDRLCSKDDIFKTANAIGNTLIELVGTKVVPTPLP